MFYLPLFCLICLWGLKRVIKPMIVDYYYAAVVVVIVHRLLFAMCALCSVWVIFIEKWLIQKYFHGMATLTMALFIVIIFIFRFVWTKKKSQHDSRRKRILLKGDFGIRNENEWLEICLIFIRSIFLFDNSIFYESFSNWGSKMSWKQLLFCRN